MKHNILDSTLTDEQFSALSNRTRRDILALILEASMDPRQIAERLDSNMRIVKRHLRILTECNLATVNLRGNIRIYAANKELLSF